MNDNIKSLTSKEWVFFIILSILWGGSFFFVEVAVQELPPLTIVALRVGLAAVILNFILYVKGLSIFTNKAVWLSFLGMGVLNNLIPFSLIVWGQTYIASGLASILNASTPLFTIIVAHFLTQDEKISGLRFIGIIMGFIGVIIMVGHDLLSGLAENAIAQFAILGAAISYAFAGVFGRRFQRMGIKPLVTATGQLTASTLLLAPIALMVEESWLLPLPSWNVMAAVAGIAFFSTAIAYILYFRLLSTAGATNVLLVTLLVPVSANLLGITMLGEQFETKQMLGMGLISFGLVIIDGRLFHLLLNRFK